MRKSPEEQFDDIARALNIPVAVIPTIRQFFLTGYVCGMDDAVNIGLDSIGPDDMGFKCIKIMLHLATIIKPNKPTKQPYPEPEPTNLNLATDVLSKFQKAPPNGNA